MKFGVFLGMWGDLVRFLLYIIDIPSVTRKKFTTYLYGFLLRTSPSHYVKLLLHLLGVYAILSI